MPPVRSFKNSLFLILLCGYVQECLPAKDDIRDVDIRYVQNSRLTKSPKDHLLHVDSFRDLLPRTATFNDAPQRTKRKVISRGGHYIISSKSSSGGDSPWGSTSGLYDSGNHNKISPYGGGWNAKGNLDKLPNGALNLEGTTPYSSQTVRRINTLKIQRRERKKISQTLKAEIAQYALRNGAGKASLRFEDVVGRRLRERVVEKFARRYTRRLSKKKKKKKHELLER